MEAALTAGKLILFSAVLILFGAAITMRFLEVRSRLSVLGLSIAIGSGMFLVLTNALGYAIPIADAFSLTLLLFAVVGILHVRTVFRLLKWEQGDALALAWLLPFGALVGLLHARFLGSDPWTWGQLPLVASIVSGNFPIRQLIDPSIMLGYHYGPQLFTAGIASVMHVSVTTAYNATPTLCAIGGLLCFSDLARRTMRSVHGMVLAPILALLGGGCMWILGWHILPDFFALLSGHAVSPFSWITVMAVSRIGPSLLTNFGSRTFMFAFLFLPSLLLCLRAAFESADRQRALLHAVAAIVLALALALSAETAFLLVLGLIPLYTLFVWRVHGSTTATRVAVMGGLILLVSLVLARFQGGVLSVLGTNSDLTLGSFRFVFDGKLALTPTGVSVRILSLQFLRDAGLPYLLLPFALVFAWRNRRMRIFSVFLAVLAALHIAAPFLVRYIPRAHELMRMNYLGIALSSFTIGLLLSSTWLRERGIRRAAASLIVAAMLGSGAVYLVFRTIFPTLRFESAPLFAAPLPETSAQRLLNAWVNEHTAPRDLFYLGIVRGDPFKLPEELAQQRGRIVFMAATGRSTIGSLNDFGIVSSAVQKGQDQIEDHCSIAAFRLLSIKYLVIETKERAVWFRARCSTSQWKTVYKDGEIRVYEVK